MFCPNCGLETKDDTLFCPECGSVMLDEPAAPVKKGLSKGAKIGIAAAAVAVIAAVVVLILVLGGGKNKLVGTWKGEMHGIEIQFTFKANKDLEIRVSYMGESETTSGKYRLDGDNTLTMEYDGAEVTVKYDKKAMEGDYDSWYIDGNILYLSGNTFRKG